MNREAASSGEVLGLLWFLLMITAMGRSKVSATVYVLMVWEGPFVVFQPALM